MVLKSMMTECSNPECDETTCQECCPHDEHDHGICLDCGLDQSEDMAAAAYDRYKDLKKYGE